jgi:predicted outer membrane repeat protein
MGLQARLELDDVSGFGPETLFFSNVGKCTGGAINCDMEYVIVDYNKRGNMKAKGAKVTLYHGDGVEGTWDIKDVDDASITHNGNFWHVFTIDGKTNKLKYSSDKAAMMMLAKNTTVATSMVGHSTSTKDMSSTTGYDGFGPFPRRKWKRRSQRGLDAHARQKSKQHNLHQDHKVHMTASDSKNHPTKWHHEGGVPSESKPHSAHKHTANHTQTAGAAHRGAQNAHTETQSHQAAAHSQTHASKATKQQTSMRGHHAK